MESVAPLGEGARSSRIDVESDATVEFVGEVDHFVAAVRPRLVGLLTIRTGDRHVAEDLAQEALARAVADWAKVSTMESPVGWVHRVALNLAASRWRRLAARRRAERRAPQPDTAPPLLTAEAIALRSALETLSERQRQVVILRFYVGCDVRETALTLDISPSTVTTLSARALARLRTELGDDDES